MGFFGVPLVLVSSGFLKVPRGSLDSLGLSLLSSVSLRFPQVSSVFLEFPLAFSGVLGFPCVSSGSNFAGFLRDVRMILS